MGMKGWEVRQGLIYLRDLQPSAVEQKWRLVGDHLVSKKTVNKELVALSHDASMGQLKVDQLACNRPDLQWKFVPVDQPLFAKNAIPEGENSIPTLRTFQYFKDC